MIKSNARGISYQVREWMDKGNKVEMRCYYMCQCCKAAFKAGRTMGRS